MSTKEVETDEEVSKGPRPVGLTFSSVFLLATGIYYIAYPLLAQDLTLLYLTGSIGAVSMIAGLGVWRLSRWGLWLGLISTPLQLVAASSYLLVIVQPPYQLSNLVVIGFIGGLVILIFLAVLSFLLLIDRRGSFKQTSK
jgi:uncharacterized membrane protein (DUF2068 family)